MIEVLVTCERRSRLVTGAAPFCPDWIYDLARFVDRAVNLEGAAIGSSEVDAEVTHLDTASCSGRARMPLDSSSSITS